MDILKFARNWTLPIAMLAGASAYFLYVSIPALDGTHALVGRTVAWVQPVMIFCMLFVSFCQVSPRQLRPKAWMLELLAVQALSFVAMGVAAVCMGNDTAGRVVLESAMLCMICPTATAAAVVTAKLRGNTGTVVTYTCLDNVVVSLLVPAMVPFLHDRSTPGMDFSTSFFLIIGKVFPLLILPLATAWVVRYAFPPLHRAVLRCKDLAFNLWAVSLALAIGMTVKAIAHGDESVWELVGIAVASLLCCVVQFAFGRVVGRRHGEAVAGAQSLGQKNTVFAIWMGYTFLNPVTAMAGGFYSVWHNVINSLQLYRERKHPSVQ